MISLTQQDQEELEAERRLERISADGQTEQNEVRFIHVFGPSTLNPKHSFTLQGEQEEQEAEGRLQRISADAPPADRDTDTVSLLQEMCSGSYVRLIDFCITQQASPADQDEETAEQHLRAFGERHSGEEGRDQP